MKLKNIFILSFVFISLFACADKQVNIAKKSAVQADLQQQLPRVLFITTGIDTRQEDKDLPKGVIVALHTFNTMGIPVRLEPRDVLFDEDLLMQYNMIILSTAESYHDADREYSLTYMSDEELNILKKYVQNGGIILAGDNTGRNYFDGTDRILKDNELNPENYPLAEVFGLILEEKNMQNYRIEGKITDELKGDFFPAKAEETWMLVPKKILSDKLSVLAYWKKDKDSIPALTVNSYGKGKACLLPTSDFIHPVSAGGLWSIAQIDAFYKFLTGEFFDTSIQVNPWIKDYQTAFAVSFNTSRKGGEEADYKRLMKFLKKNKLSATFFVNGTLNDTLASYLKGKNLSLGSTGYEYLNFNYVDYATAVNDILRNNIRWQRKFTGFRFPYTNPSFEGLVAISQHGFTYESSLSANNLEFLQGSVVPYNLVFAKDNYYQSTDIMELSPTYHDDYFYLQNLREGGYPNPDDLKKDALLWQQYLLDYWQYAVQPNNGAMIYLGHPDLTGHNEVTLSALQVVRDSLQKQKVWMTSLESLKNYRDFYNKVRFFVKKKSGKYTVDVVAPEGMKVKDFSIKLTSKPQNVSSKKGKVEVMEDAGNYYVIFDAFDGQELKFELIQ